MGQDPRHRQDMDASQAAVLMLQLAASHAQIGPFAQRDRETPQLAAARYGAAHHAVVPGRPRARLA